MGYENYTIMVYLLQEEVFDMFRLKILREQRHLSQVFLGMELGMSQNSISRYETGAREADYDTLIAFADYFQVSIDYLLGRTENPEINR